MKGKKLQEAVASPWFTWLAGAAGLVIFVTLKALPLPEGRIPDEILETPTPVFIPIAAVAILWLLKLIILDFGNRRRRLPRDFLYKSVVYRWHYQANGNVSGSCIFDVENRSQSPIERLPVEGLIWYNQITEKTINFRIIVRESERLHRFEEDGPLISKIDHVIDFVRNRTGFKLDWSPRIVPALEPGETIAYEVEISTPRTEKDAFTPAGTTVGFPVSRFTDRVELHAFSPVGHKFERLQPDVTISDMDDGEGAAEVPGRLARPTISQDGAHVAWEVDYPLVKKRYYFHYRFIKKNK